MPYLKCSKCHHEFESVKKEDYKCDWCGSSAYVLEEETPLERMLKDKNFFNKWIDKIKNHR